MAPAPIITTFILLSPFSPARAREPPQFCHNVQELTPSAIVLRQTTPLSAQRKLKTMPYVHLPSSRFFGPGLCVTGALLMAAPGGAAAVECGDVLTGVEQLEDDLICTTDPALTLSGGRLDLRGHAVICDGTLEGVVLDATGAQLRNGAVAGCQFAVLVEGGGNHVVANVTASVVDPVPDDEESAEGIRVSSDGNRLLRNRILLGGTNAIRINGAENRVVGNTISGSERGVRVDGVDNRVTDNVIGGVAEGIEVRGDSNWIRRNQVAGALDQAIELRGSQNRVIGNLAVDSPGDGISIFSNGNLIRGNGVFGNADDGIIVVATFGNNRVVRNRALGNGTDLTDQNVDCADNTWANNTFDTADPDACID